MISNRLIKNVCAGTVASGVYALHADASNKQDDGSDTKGNSDNDIRPSDTTPKETISSLQVDGKTDADEQGASEVKENVENEISIVEDEMRISEEDIQPMIRPDDDASSDQSQDDTNSRAEEDLNAFNLEQQQAIDDEEFLKAHDIQKKIEELKSQNPMLVTEEMDESIAQQNLNALYHEKLAAIFRKDFLLANNIKEQMNQLTSQYPKLFIPNAESKPDIESNTTMSGWDKFSKNDDSVLSMPSANFQSSSGVHVVRSFKIGDNVCARIEFTDKNNQMVTYFSIVGAISQYDLASNDKYEFTSVDLGDEEYIQIEKNLKAWKACDAVENDYWIEEGGGKRFGIIVREQYLTAVCTSNETLLNKYVIEKYLGQGAFGCVYQGRAVDEKDKKYAIKENRNLRGNEIVIAQKETEFLKPLKHENIIQYQDAFSHNNNYYIVLEFANAGDLLYQINKQRKNKKKWTNCIIQDCFRQIVAGLDYLHSYRKRGTHGILHRDLKPQNILVCHSDKGIVFFKIADFGLAREMEESQASVHTFAGTRVYMSPEALSNSEHYSFPSDIWSLGCILYDTWDRAFDKEGDIYQVSFADDRQASNIVNGFFSRKYDARKYKDGDSLKSWFNENPPKTIIAINDVCILKAVPHEFLPGSYTLKDIKQDWSNDYRRVGIVFESVKARYVNSKNEEIMVGFDHLNSLVARKEGDHSVTPIAQDEGFCTYRFSNRGGRFLYQAQISVSDFSGKRSPPEEINWTSPGNVAEVLWDFEAQIDTELSVTRGEYVVITNDSDSWFHGYRQTDPQKKIGLFPGNYVEKFLKDEMRWRMFGGNLEEPYEDLTQYVVLHKFVTNSKQAYVVLKKSDMSGDWLRMRTENVLSKKYSYIYLYFEH